MLKTLLIVWLAFIPIAPKQAQPKPKDLTIEAPVIEKVKIVKRLQPIVYIVEKDDSRTVYVFVEKHFSSEDYILIGVDIAKLDAIKKRVADLRLGDSEIYKEDGQPYKTLRVKLLKTEGWYSRVIDLYATSGVLWLRPHSPDEDKSEEEDKAPRRAE